MAAKKKVTPPAAKAHAPGGAAKPLAIRRARLDELHNDPANVRKHDSRNIQAIVASLKTFGQVEPLVVQKGTGKVIGGNGRLEAMRAMGLDECDIVELDFDHVKATALGVTLNRTAELASWDDTALAETLRALQSEDFDLDAAGFTGDEVDRLCERLASGIAAADGEAVDDPQGEWEGMPEFEHQDLTSQFRAIVHFANEADMRAFEGLVGQKIPTNTRSMWFPKAERQVVKGSGYVSDES